MDLYTLRYDEAIHPAVTIWAHQPSEHCLGQWKGPFKPLRFDRLGSTDWIPLGNRSDGRWGYGGALTSHLMAGNELLIAANLPVLRSDSKDYDWMAGYRVARSLSIVFQTFSVQASTLRGSSERERTLPPVSIGYVGADDAAKGSTAEGFFSAACVSRLRQHASRAHLIAEDVSRCTQNALEHMLGERLDVRASVGDPHFALDFPWIGSSQTVEATCPVGPVEQFGPGFSFQYDHPHSALAALVALCVLSEQIS